MRDFRVSAIIISAVLCLALFWVGTSLYEAHGTEEPLRELLADHPAVRESEVRRGGLWEVRVTLHPTDDLRATYTDLAGAIKEVVPDDRYHLEIENSSTEFLQNWWDELSLYVYEGASNANFAQMRDRLTAAVSGEDLSMAVQVDEERIYLRLKSGDYDLYRVVDRTDHRERSEPIE